MKDISIILAHIGIHGIKVPSEGNVTNQTEDCTNQIVLVKHPLLTWVCPKRVDLSIYLSICLSVCLSIYIHTCNDKSICGLPSF